MVSLAASRLLTHDSGALMTRLEQVKPFELHMPMVAAAVPSLFARHSVEAFFDEARTRLRHLVTEFRAWLSGPEGRAAGDAEALRRFTVVRLQFQRLLTQFDLFADALTQRSEHDFGVWLAGLDVLARDALKLPDAPYEAPPLICYLDRGIGAAIRRARTRLPGGGSNPVSIIRVPRERMIGTGVSGSLVHEVGHQGAALLDLVRSLRPVLRRCHRRTRQARSVWMLWERWISEIVADLWSVAMTGIGATYGMIGVVTLPRAFVFRIAWDDPHPPPWVRVRLSAAMGDALYPDPQWAELTHLWERLYEPGYLSERKRRLFDEVDRSIPEFVPLLLEHRPPALEGAQLTSLFPLTERTPYRLRTLSKRTRCDPMRLSRLDPTIAMAVLGQSRADGRIGPSVEGRVIEKLLTTWATRRHPAQVTRRATEDER